MAETNTSVPTESSTELALLTSNLQQVQHKMINQWTGKNLDQYLQQNHLTHEQWLQQATDQVNEIKGQLDRLHEESAQNKEVIATQKRKAEQIGQEIQEVGKKRQKLMFQKEQLLTNVQEKSKEIEKETEYLELQQKATRKLLNELNKSEDFFRERMGLKFKKLDSDNLQFVFTNIDRKDHERVFYFTIKIVGKDYQITDCYPPVEGMDELLQQLNKSNDLMAFVVTVRQKFKLAS